MYKLKKKKFPKQLEDFSNRVGRYFRPKPMSRGDSIALVMESRVEYVGTWLGLSKAGYVTALVNTNLRGDVLVHSINVAGCKAVIFSGEFKEGMYFFAGYSVNFSYRRCFIREEKKTVVIIRIDFCHSVDYVSRMKCNVES